MGVYSGDYAMTMLSPTANRKFGIQWHGVSILYKGGPKGKENFFSSMEKYLIFDTGQ